MRDAGRAVQIWGRTVWLKSPLPVVAGSSQVLKFQANDANLMGWTCVGRCAWSCPIFPELIKGVNGSPLLPMETQFKRFIWKMKALGSGGKCPMLGDCGSQPIYTITSLCRLGQVTALLCPCFLIDQWGVTFCPESLCCPIH